jgi:hypothetical protein
MKNIIFISLLYFLVQGTYGQGCSDAGICSIGHGFEKANDKNNTLEVATIFGAGEADVTYFSPYISYTRKVSDRFSWSSKVTFSSANGSFGTRTSLGDAFLVGNYRFTEKKDAQWSITSGFKIPFTTANLKINGYSIPLDYQASLGTFDWLLSTNLKYKKWDFNTAIQVPVFNNNKNSYFKEFSGTNDFPSTNLFERRADALFRTTYTLQTANKKWLFKPNVLFIYHLGEDTFKNRFGIREKIMGSDGLTINGNLVSSYALTANSALEVSLATPFVVRDARPDGLTRSFVFAVQYNISF